MRGLRPKLFVLAMLTLTASRDGRGGLALDPTHDELIRQVARSLEPATAGGHSGELLQGMRELGDARLRPFFAELAQKKRWDLRAQGILGLAELSPERRINVLMVRELETPAQQAMLLGEALNENLLGIDQVREVLSWPDLDPTLEVLLRARLLRSGEKQDVARLRALSGAENPVTGLLALLVLEQAESEESRQATGSGQIFQRLQELPEAERSGALMVLLEHARRERLTRSAAPGAFIDQVLAQSATDANLNAQALRTLLALEPTRGSASWVEAWGRTSSLAARLRLALVALDAVAYADPSVYATLSEKDDQPLLTSMGRAGRAVGARLRSREADSGEAVAALVDLCSANYPPATAWALDACETLDGECAVVAAAAFVEAFGLNRPGGRNAAAGEVVMEAAAQLARLASRPSEADASSESAHDYAAARRLTALLHQAAESQDEFLCRAMLLGLLRGGTRSLWGPSSGVIGPGSPSPAWPGRGSAALATVYEARVDPTFEQDPGRRALLKEIALGWGSLPDVHRTQAAWLSLCLDGQDRQALARVLSEGGDE